jgi:hypothetical protein
VDFVVSEEIFGFITGTRLGEEGFAALFVEAVEEIQADCIVVFKGVNNGGYFVESRVADVLGPWSESGLRILQLSKSIGSGSELTIADLVAYVAFGLDDFPMKQFLSPGLLKGCIVKV